MQKQVQVSSARLSQIGTILRNADGKFTAGPIPGIGGPFDTAAAFVEAWAASIRFPYEEKRIREWVPPNVAEEILQGIQTLPSRLAKLAVRGKLFNIGGPFPIRHADFWHSNIVVTEGFNVLGVIDWEGAFTVPWELIDAPCFLNTVPRMLNPAEQYNEVGEPIDQDEVKRWEEKANYVSIVHEAECEAGIDHKLSKMLADKDAQDLAAIFHLFREGKMGFYSQALDFFESLHTT